MENNELTVIECDAGFDITIDNELGTVTITYQLDGEGKEIGEIHVISVEPTFDINGKLTGHKVSKPEFRMKIN